MVSAEGGKGSSVGVVGESEGNARQDGWGMVEETGANGVICVKGISVNVSMGRYEISESGSERCGATIKLSAVLSLL